MQHRNSFPSVSAGMSRFPHRMRGWRRFVVAAPLVGVSMVSSSECFAGLEFFGGSIYAGISALNPDGVGGNDLRMAVVGGTNTFLALIGGRTAVDYTTPSSVPPGVFSATRTVSGDHNNWPNVGQYFAFRLDGSGYGWIKVDAGFGGNNLVYQGVYDTAATSPIQTGAIPEPSSFALLGLLATGAAGVMAWKRCRRKQQQGDGVEE